MYKHNLQGLTAKIKQLHQDGSQAVLDSIREAAKQQQTHVLQSDVGAGLGNTAKRLALGKGKKATYAAEKKAAKGLAKETAIQAKPTQFQSDTPDPWLLETNAVKKDWTQMACPNFEMFHWKRLVVDEFTYLDRRDIEIVRSLQANYRYDF